MLSPKELLVRSVVSYQGKPCLVKGVAQYIMLEGYKEWIGGSQMEGENLSEEWVAHLGFESLGDGEWIKYLELTNWAIKIKCSHIEGWSMLQGFADQWQHIRAVYYIHQVQLIFFATSGEHLKTPKLK